MSSIKIRATVSDGLVSVKARIEHPMETGLRKDRETDQPIPAHYIQQVTCEHKERVVLSAYWGPSVSKDPYLSCRFSGGATGDSVRIRWTDNLGDSGSEEAEIR